MAAFSPIVRGLRPFLDNSPFILGSNPVTTSLSRAAQRTNRISGAFLLHSGEGYVSEDVLRLLALLCSGADGQRVRDAAARVAAFGSTSGSDILTGIVLAIIHHDGGKNSGKAGNQKERLL